MAAMKTDNVKAFCHITGGGFSENIPRILPEGIGIHIDLGSFELPAMFGWAAQIAELPALEMLRTFNCGIGMIAVCDSAQADSVVAAIQSKGDTASVIGSVTAHAEGPKVTYTIPKGWPC